MSAPGQLLGQVTITIARHRRILAAVCAGVATLLILSLFVDSANQPEIPLSETTVARQLKAGEVAVPILLADAQLADGVNLGDFVDLVALSDEAPASVIAEHARVLSRGSGGTNFRASSAAMLVVAVDTADALPVAAAGASGSLTLLLRTSTV